MKRKMIATLFVLALIFSSTACTALELNTDEVKVVEKQDSNSTAAPTTAPDIGKVEEENTEKDEVLEEQDFDNTTAPDADEVPDENTEKEKMVEKQDSKSTTAPNKSKVVGKKNTDSGKQNSDLDDKADVLQADTEEYIKSIIEKRSMDVLTAIKNYDIEKLAGAVHPDKGVRFSPYGYVDVENNLVFTAEELRKLATNSKPYLWGYYDGSGEPISLIFSDYHKKFIYDVDFVNAEQVGYNKILGHGNSLNNSFEVYKNSIIVEYYFSGFDPQYAGLDWRSLRLVFEKKDDIWYIVGIIHDQWTS